MFFLKYTSHRISHLRLIYYLRDIYIYKNKHQNWPASPLFSSRMSSLEIWSISTEHSPFTQSWEGFSHLKSKGAFNFRTDREQKNYKNENIRLKVISSILSTTVYNNYLYHSHLLCTITYNSFISALCIVTLELSLSCADHIPLDKCWYW
jgi:hypothetical protein